MFKLRRYKVVRKECSITDYNTEYFFTKMMAMNRMNYYISKKYDEVYLYMFTKNDWVLEKSMVL